MKLKVTSLGKYYNYRWVFKDLDFESNGIVLGISGSNGTGKSTLLRILAGLVRQDAGEVEWIGEPAPGELFNTREHSGYAAPYIQLYGELTCRENLRFLRASLPAGVVETDFDSVMNEIGIGDKIDAAYRSLSSGQQQRVKIISAIQSDPPVLFLDEPGTNLDQSGLIFIRDIIDKRRASAKLTILASNVQNELDFCDQIISLS